MTSSTPPVQDWISALRASHDRFRSLVADLEASDLAGPSYDSEWTLADVASHIGSGAEIFALFLEAGLRGVEPPGVEAMHPIWDTWNARSSVARRDECLVSDDALVDAFEATTEAEREKFRMGVFGMDLDLAGLAGLRLSEAAVHTWDVAVALDPTATVDAEAVRLLLDGLAQTAARTAGPTSDPFTVLVLTSDPDGAFLVSAGDRLAIGAAATNTPADGTVTLPAEAYLRLVYGRLDPEHTGSVTESGTRGLADLRELLKGF